MLLISRTRRPGRDPRAGLRELRVEGEELFDLAGQLCRLERLDQDRLDVASDPLFEGYFDAALFAEALRLAGKDPTRASPRNAFENKVSKITINGISPGFSPNEHQGLSKVRVLRLKTDASAFENF